jgi:hypothetical protein
MLEPMNRESEHRHAGAQREGGVGVAQVIEVAQRLYARGALGAFPVATPKAAEVDPPPKGVRKQNLVL